MIFCLSGPPNIWLLATPLIPIYPQLRKGKNLTEEKCVNDQTWNRAVWGHQKSFELESTWVVKSICSDRLISMIRGDFEASFDKSFDCLGAWSFTYLVVEQVDKTKQFLWSTSQAPCQQSQPNEKSSDFFVFVVCGCLVTSFPSLFFKSHVYTGAWQTTLMCLHKCRIVYQVVRPWPNHSPENKK